MENVQEVNPSFNGNLVSAEQFMNDEVSLQASAIDMQEEDKASD